MNFDLTEAANLLDSPVLKCVPVYVLCFDLADHFFRQQFYTAVAMDENRFNVLCKITTRVTF